MHIRWTGLLPVALVQSIIDIAMCVQIIRFCVVHDLLCHRTIPFACLAASSIPLSPVTVVPTRTTNAYAGRAPRSGSEDSWCLLITSQDNGEIAQYIVAESVGRWDARWG